MTRPPIAPWHRLWAGLLAVIFAIAPLFWSPAAAHAQSELYTKDVYFSFFMFTTNLQPDNCGYLQQMLDHMKVLQAMGYNGFEFPIAPPTGEKSYAEELHDYENLRLWMDRQGLENAQVATNVGATRTYDPSSPYPEQRQQALDYLKSRVDITAALRGEIMMGPIVIPYGVFPVQDDGSPIWSDALQEELQSRYANAQPILDELGRYAEQQNVKLAIEPITHWETPGPNTLAQVLTFLEGVASPQVGVVIDSSHEVLDGAGPIVFQQQVQTLAAQGRLHYAQVSPPDRGAVDTSWIPWQSVFEPILEVYDGPVAVEIFNAIPAFTNSLRLTRRKFWIPGEDEPNEYPSAYDIAERAITATRLELGKIVNPL